MTLPRRLAAPPATWERDVDVVVLGSGAAGLSAALAVRPVRSVLVVTKDILSAGSTQWAQGGLAGVLDPSDTIEDHVRDTLEAGAGLCDEAVVRQLVTEAPKSIRYLMRLGAAFDPEQGGTDIALTREGGHSHNRIVHAGGDRSGAEVQRTLDESAIGAGVEVMGHAFALDLVTGTADDGERQVVGVRIGKTDEHGVVASVGVVTARAVVIASGGYGQVFASTSNPPAVTGDGVAMALRAGLSVTDVEFVQFHPTVMWRGPDALGQQALVSEAVRGEGAILFDAAGERVMVGVHPLEDLAPRDVVAAAISRRMAEAPGGVDDHVYLDATHMGERFYERFPSITRSVPRDRPRPGRRPDPGRPGRALRLRRHPRRARRPHGASRSLRRRRGVGDRRPRSEPAGLEQPHRVGRVRHVGGPRPGVGAARARRDRPRRGRSARSSPARPVADARGSSGDVTPRRRRCATSCRWRRRRRPRLDRSYHAHGKAGAGDEATGGRGPVPAPSRRAGRGRPPTSSRWPRRWWPQRPRAPRAAVAIADPITRASRPSGCATSTSPSTPPAPSTCATDPREGPIMNHAHLRRLWLRRIALERRRPRAHARAHRRLGRVRARRHRRGVRHRCRTARRDRRRPRRVRARRDAPTARTRGGTSRRRGVRTDDRSYRVVAGVGGGVPKASIPHARSALPA